jgi:peptidoglycan/xylan/chitin deacetylase (PgdA/CDA1 family)
MRIKIKSTIAHILYYMGIIWLLERILLRTRCVVLVYHRITKPEEEVSHVQDGMYVTPDVFEKHLQYLRKNYTLMSLEDLIKNLKTRRHFRKAYHITFDDGWIDNYANAFPLLKKYSIPATIFVATDFIGTSKWFWPERVLYLLFRTKGTEFQSDINLESREILSIFHQTSVSREDRINNALNFLKDKSNETISAVIEDLKKIAQINKLPQKRLLLEWDEIRDMGENGIAFGSHTKTHAILTNYDDDEEIRSELIESKRIIERKTGKIASGFCFPNGNTTPKLNKIVEDTGYQCAFGGNRGTLKSHDNLYTLRRIGIHNDVSNNIPLFTCRILFSFF